ncbi:MAG: hypothetical protein IIX02_04115 [Clostridia bacterium]|nr:hypothetical protein [Clostridia bacterium]
MLNTSDKEIYDLICLLKESEDYETAAKIEAKAMQYGYKIFTETDDILTVKEKALFDKVRAKMD